MNREEEFRRELELLRTGGLKTSPLRMEYEEKVRGLSALREHLLKEGKPVEEAARLLHGERRRLGEVYKAAAPPLFHDYILWATERKYGDPLGPSYEQLRLRRTPEQILESASRPIEDLDSRLTVDGFIRWFREEK